PGSFPGRNALLLIGANPLQVCRGQLIERGRYWPLFVEDLPLGSFDQALLECYLCQPLVRADTLTSALTIDVVINPPNPLLPEYTHGTPPTAFPLPSRPVVGQSLWCRIALPDRRKSSPLVSRPNTSSASASPVHHTSWCRSSAPQRPMSPAW